IENEYDHVYVGTFEGTPLINTLEVEDYKFISERELREHMKENPDQYTYWFKLIVESNTLTNFFK
ncbi:MAG: isopentenyl-diphosphate delta-isomerase, partial [Cyclobacteriaceae bacterium]|nr:isopentenyl-diphosphate delta-isomerase [Cyclobacteriaceae bacterium]